MSVIRERANILFRIRRSWFGLRLKLAQGRFARGKFRASRFLLVPPHHHLGDPTIAADFAEGQIVLAGRILRTHGRQPFTMDAPSQRFAAALAGFQWLVHFDASDRRALKEYARLLAKAFMQRRELDRRAHVENPSTVARRVISWITHSALLTEGADAASYRRILDHLARDVALLYRYLRRRDAGLARLQAALAVLYHALCTDMPERMIGKAEAHLAAAISATIHPDGFTRDRNAASMARVAADLDPLAAIYRARKRAMPAFVGQTIARVVSALRLVRHPDGALMLVNGAGLVSRDLVGEATSLWKGGQNPQYSAPDAGFERLENEHGVLIADSGGVTPPSFAANVGASALAIEFSTRTDRIIVNCGIPASAEGEIARAWRSGAAHSAILMEDEAPGRFVSRPNLRGVRDDLLLRRDEPVLAARRMTEDGEMVTLGHSGFRAQHGYVVERQITLMADGSGLIGLDRLVKAEAIGEEKSVRIQFHLDPRVQAVPLSGGDAIVLRLPSAPAGSDVWVFQADGVRLDLDDSRIHETEGAAQTSRQIVITLVVSETTSVVWRLAPYRPEFA